jgi:NAD(P)-dependent dehydrogenase (short-subunit alcohol dehydrogenase family)
MKLSGSVSFVTGGANGIGKVLCETILERGGSVGFVDLNEKQGNSPPPPPPPPSPPRSDSALRLAVRFAVETVAAEWRKRYGTARVWCGVCDVTDSVSLEHSIRSTVQYFGGRLNAVINNAGIVRACTPHRCRSSRPTSDRKT